jgi:hypothetical protein
MTRWPVGTLVAALLVGPWAGCEREPVTPPAGLPGERAPLDAVDEPELDDVILDLILLDAAHRRG